MASGGSEVARVVKWRVENQRLLEWSSGEWGIRGGKSGQVASGESKVAKVVKWRVGDQRWLEWSSGEWRIRGA